jgi:hypothetical protein
MKLKMKASHMHGTAGAKRTGGLFGFCYDLTEGCVSARFQQFRVCIGTFSLQYLSFGGVDPKRVLRSAFSSISS